MEYKKQIMKGFNLHLIKTNKFKNCHVEIIFRNNINVYDITKRQFLTRLLCESNIDYPTRRKLLLKLEDLYSASIDGITSKVGGSILTSFWINFLNENFTEKGMMNDSIKLLFDLILKPLVRTKEFDYKTFEIIKNRIRDGINITLENPSKYASIKALELLGDTPTSYNSLGSLEALEDITPENIYHTYEEMLKNDYIDIFVVGDIDIEDVSNTINECANFKVIKNHPVNMYVVNPKIKEKNLIEYKDINQSQIVMILNLNNLTDYEKKYTAIIYNMILGGGSMQTKLFQKLRNEKSLCYTVSSYYQKYDGIILITTGVETNSSEKAIKLIKQTIKEMSYNITDEELKCSKELIISSLNYINDNIERITNNYYYQDLGEIDSLETRIKNFKTISKDDIYSLHKKISISVVYNLQGGTHE